MHPHLLFRHSIYALLATCLMAFAALPTAAQTATYVLDSPPGDWISNLSNPSNSPFPFNYNNMTSGGTYTKTDGTILGFPIDLTINGTGINPAVYTTHNSGDGPVTDVTGFLDAATIQITDKNSLVVDSYTGSLTYSEQLNIYDDHANLSGDVFNNTGKEYVFTYAATSDQYDGTFAATASFAPVPEVSSAVSFGLLAALGLLGLAWTARRRHARRT